MAGLVAPVIGALELALGEEIVSSIYRSYLGAGYLADVVVGDEIASAYAAQYDGLGSYESIRTAANAGFATDVGLATTGAVVGVTTVTNIVNNVVADVYSHKTPDVTIVRRAPSVGQKRTRAGEGIGSSTDLNSTMQMEVVGSGQSSQLIKSYLAVVMDIPLRLKAKPVILGRGDRPQTTPKQILDLFPTYYQNDDKLNIINARANLPGKQDYVDAQFLDYSTLLSLYEKCKWTLDQASANVVTTDYAGLPPTTLGSLGYPYLVPNAAVGGGSIVAGQSVQDLGMWYTHTNKLEWYNPNSTCAYVTVQVHSSKSRPNSNTGAAPNDAGMLSPTLFYTTYGSQRGDNRFFVSSAQGPGADPGNLATVAPAINTPYEANPTDLSIIGSTPRGAVFQTWFNEHGMCKFILPPGAMCYMYIRKPRSFFDLGMHASSSSNPVAPKHTYWVTTYWHGQTGFAGTVGDGADNWGEVSAGLSMRSTVSNTCRFHTKKRAEGMDLIYSSSYILAANQNHISVGDPNPTASRTGDGTL